MKHLAIAVALVLAACLSGCGDSCTPSAGYIVPAHWVPGHYAYEAGWYWTRAGNYIYGAHKVYRDPEYVAQYAVAPVTCRRSQ